MEPLEVVRQRYIEKANEGDVESQSSLASLCLMFESYEEAFKWASKAAEQDDAVSQRMLGVMFKEGLGVTQSYENAAIWYRLAAEQGDAIAQASLGFLYLSGNGVTKSAEDAYKWYAKAAEQGNVNAQYILGSMYKNGFVVSQSNEEAEKWFRLSAEQGLKEAQQDLLSLLANKKMALRLEAESRKLLDTVDQIKNPDEKKEILEKARKMVQEAERLLGTPPKPKESPIADNNRSGEVYDSDDDVNKENGESVGSVTKFTKYIILYFIIVVFLIIIMLI